MTYSTYDNCYVNDNKARSCVGTCGSDGVDGTGFTSNASLRTADDAEVVGGAARRSFPLEEGAFDVLRERHPLSHCTVLDDIMVDWDSAALRRQPGDH